MIQVGSRVSVPAKVLLLLNAQKNIIESRHGRIYGTVLQVEGLRVMIKFTDGSVKWYSTDLHDVRAL